MEKEPSATSKSSENEEHLFLTLPLKNSNFSTPPTVHELQLETMVMVFIIRMLGEVLDYSGINAANLVLSISFDT